MKTDWNALMPALIVPVFVIILAVIFRDSLKLLIRRIRKFDYSDARGHKMSIESDPELSLPQQTSTEPSSPDREEEPNPTSTISSTPTAVVSSNLPNKLYSNLVGRTDEVHKALQFLHSPTSGTILGLDGFGGIGKTALAREIAENALETGRFQFVYWTTAKRASLEHEETTIGLSTRVTYNSVLSGIANWLGIDSELYRIRGKAKKEKRIKEILDASPCLIVVDNLETANVDQNELAAIHLKQILGNSKAILTSRQRWDRTAEIFSITVKGLSWNESIEFMKMIARDRHIERVELAEPAQLGPLVQITGGVPLVLKLATGFLSFQDVNALEIALKTVSSQEINEMYSYLYLSSWRKLSESHKNLLLALAQFSGDIGASASNLKKMNVVEITQFDNTINFLIQLSLVEVSGTVEFTRYSLHPLTLNFVRKELLSDA